MTDRPTLYASELLPECWQPIETVPEGIRVLVLAWGTVRIAQKQVDDREEPGEEVSWYIEGWEERMDYGSPTHWMPIPAPPRTDD